MTRPSPSLADRVKSNKRQRSNSSHSKSEKKENKSKHREQSEHKSSPSPVRKQSKTSSTPSKSTSSNHYVGSYPPAAPQLTTTLSTSLPPFEKFEAMLDELFDMGKKDAVKKQKRSSSSSDDSEEEDEAPHAKTNGDSSPPSLFDITIDGNTLAQLVGVTAKLKKSHQMQSAPVSKISTLLTVLTQQLTVQSAGLKTRKSAEETAAAGSDDEDEDRNITNSASMMHKFESCCDTCLIALYILSSKGKFCILFVDSVSSAFLRNAIPCISGGVHRTNRLLPEHDDPAVYDDRGFRFKSVQVKVKVAEEIQYLHFTDFRRK